MSKKKEIKVLMMGLEDSGKTSILYAAKFGETVTTTPTLGFNYNSIEIKKKTVGIWDFGGKEEVHKVYSKHYAGTKGLIFVVDPMDKNIKKSIEMLHGFFCEEELKGCPVAIFKNKSDLSHQEGFLTEKDVLEKYELKKFGKKRKVKVFSTNFMEQDSILKGMEWLVKNIKK